MARVGEPSILERRQATQNVENSNAHERRLFRRAARDASRLARKSKNPRFALQAISIADEAKRRGIKAFGLSNRDDNINFAQAQLQQFSRDQQTVRKGVGRRRALGEIADNRIKSELEVSRLPTARTASVVPEDTSSLTTKPTTAAGDTQPPVESGLEPVKAGTAAAEQTTAPGVPIPEEDGREAPTGGQPTEDQGGGSLEDLIDQASPSLIGPESPTLEQRRDSGDFGITFDGERQIKTDRGFVPQDSPEAEEAAVRADPAFSERLIDPAASRARLAEGERKGELLQADDDGQVVLDDLGPADKKLLIDAREERNFSEDRERFGGIEAVRRAAGRRKREKDRDKIFDDARKAVRTNDRNAPIVVSSEPPSPAALRRLARNNKINRRRLDRTRVFAGTPTRTAEVRESIKNL